MRMYDKIYLQTDGRNAYDNDIDNDDYETSVTWCVDSINDTDTEYIRSDIYTALQAENAAQAAEIKRLRKQLPDGMSECTIVFMECEKGHGRLTATNWVDHGCRVCEIERLREALLSAREYISTRDITAFSTMDDPFEWKLIAKINDALKESDAE